MLLKDNIPLLHGAKLEYDKTRLAYSDPDKYESKLSKWVEFKNYIKL